MAVKFNTGLIFFVGLLVSFESRSVNKGAVERRSGTCHANGRTYNHGDTVIYRNVTYPIESAACTSCTCSYGSVTECGYWHCDIGLGMPIEACENWVTGEEGICCPRCTCTNNGETWAKHVSSGACYECSCQSSSVDCNLIWCLKCDGITEAVPGSCCPKCTPTAPPPTTSQVFTIAQTTTRALPEIPFPFPFGKKRDMMSRDDGEEFDDEDLDDETDE